MERNGDKEKTEGVEGKSGRRSCPARDHRTSREDNQRHVLNGFFVEDLGKTRNQGSQVTSKQCFIKPSCHIPICMIDLSECDTTRDHPILMHSLSANKNILGRLGIPPILLMPISEICCARYLSTLNDPSRQDLATGHHDG